MIEDAQAKRLRKKTYDAAWRARNPDKMKKYDAAYRARNSDKIKKARAVYRARNPDKIKKRRAAWGARNPDKIKKCKAAWQARNPDKMKKLRAAFAFNLSDLYVKQVLRVRTTLKNSDIPQELVELKRAHLKIHRKLKNQK